MSLRTNYKDDVFTGSRKYSETDNGDGTISFTDETNYTQVGDTYGAAQINEANAIINDLDTNVYRTDGTAETSIADNDYFPFYDTSASAQRKTLWSNIKSVLNNVFAIKVHNGTTASTYGAGNASYFGHVKLSDAYLTNGGGASSSVGASSTAVYNAYTKLNNQLKANSNEIYMDYKNGKYGYNTSPNRGADTFYPFSSDFTITITLNTASTIRNDDDNTYQVASPLTSTSTFTFVDSDSCRIKSYTLSNATVSHSGNTWTFTVSTSQVTVVNPGQGNTNGINTTGTVTLTIGI